jgi:hypothetical protein
VPLFKIHDTTLVHARWPDSEAWQTYRITRKTANSVFIATSAGELQLDRVALERTGRVKRQGRWYVLRRPHSRHIEERKIA